MGHYLASSDSEGILRSRIAADMPLQTLAYGESIEHHGVKLSFHPAGHVLGSAQVRLEYKGRSMGRFGRLQGRAGRHLRAVRAGALPYLHHRIDLRPADLQVAGANRGLPRDQRLVARQRRGRTASVLFCYAFGKAQRILHGLDESIGTIVVHGAVEPLNKVYREGGIHLPPTVYAGDLKKGDPRLKQAIILAPPSAGGSMDAPLR